MGGAQFSYNKGSANTFILVSPGSSTISDKNSMLLEVYILAINICSVLNYMLKKSAFEKLVL